MTAYPHTVATITARHDRAGEQYCTACRAIMPLDDCERHPSYPRVIVSPADVRPGDVIRYPFGVHNVPEIVTVHGVHAYDDGSLSIRFRFTSNPRGIDWSGHIAPDAADVSLLSRGVAHVDARIRSMLP